MDLTEIGILVTGASRGLGRALAVGLGGMGCKRLFLAARGEEDLEKTLEEVRSAGGDGRIHSVDVAREAEVCQTVIRAERECGPIAVLVNSAGIGRYNPLEMLTPGEMTSMIETNLTGTIQMTQAVYQRMRPRARGLIVNVLSTAGREPKARETVYCASKWGVMGFTKSLALEARKYKIRVTAFCPGGMDTSFWGHEAQSRRPDPNRLMNPETAAESLIHLLSLPEEIEIPELAIRVTG